MADSEEVPASARGTKGASRHSTGGMAFELELESVGCKTPGSGKPKAVTDRTSNESTVAAIDEKLNEAEERRKKLKEEGMKKIIEHNQHVENVAKDPNRKNRESVDAEPTANE